MVLRKKEKDFFISLDWKISQLKYCITIAQTFPVLCPYKCSDHAGGLHSETNMAENDFNVEQRAYT